MLCSLGIRGRQNVCVCVCVCVSLGALQFRLPVCSGLVVSLYDTHAAVLGTQLIHFLTRGVDNSGHNRYAFFTTGRNSPQAGKRAGRRTEGWGLHTRRIAHKCRFN